MDFQVGDKVRIDSPDSELYGQEGKIAEIYDDGVLPILVVVEYNGDMRLFSMDALTKVKTKIPHGWLRLNY